MDTDDFSMLLSNQKGFLRQAIGRRIVDIERFFSTTIEDFVAAGIGKEQDYFSRNSGPTQIIFEGGLIQPFAVWGEQLSIVVTTPLEDTVLGEVYSLTDTEFSEDRLRICLGRICRDVRIWTYLGDFESEEAKEAAVSYLLEEGVELFYCIYLHKDLDEEYVMIGDELPRDRVAKCFSIERNCTIAPESV